jgi:hopanoid biosynthesis associated radical SAM protein HpnH
VGRERYPLVLMLEPLFRCNLACAGCGKIDYPDEILNQRMSVADCMQARRRMRRAGRLDRRRRAAAAQGMPKIVKGIIARKKFVYLCTNALLLEKKIEGLRASSLFHLVGPSRRRQGDARQVGVPGRAPTTARSRPSSWPRRRASASTSTARCSTTPTRSGGAFFDDVMAMGVDGITVSPGYAYERAPDQQHFLNRGKTKQLFRDIFARQRRQGLVVQPVGMFLDFLAGNQTYQCTPWGNPTRTVFGWQKPCYLLGEGYAKTFKELMEEHRLGRLRRRQLREVRRLHGAFAASRPSRRGP